jgi:hypothetical protein
MVRIVSKSKLLDLAHQSLMTHIKNNGYPSKFEYKNNDLHIHIHNNEIKLELINQQTSYTITCLLMGASYLTLDQSIQQLLDLKPFNILLLDHV